MSDITPQTKARADILKAIAHPTRLFIMEELAKGERCVCDLHQMAGSDLSTVSKHLSVLRNVGLVEIDKRGPQVFYSLTTPCILKFVNCIDAVIQSNAKRHMELVK